MKKFLLAAAGVAALGFAGQALGFAGQALAADLEPHPYSKAAPAWIPATYDWSGLIVGINGGWGSSHDCFDFTTPTGTFIASEGCHNATGAVFGGQIGYRWQAGGWVFGIEVQGDWANLRGTNQSLFTPAFMPRSSVNDFGLLTGQVGYAVDTALFYVKGGGAVTANQYDVLATAGGALTATTSSQTRGGGTVGAGFEFSFTPNWSIGAEYDHLFMQDKLTTFTAAAGGLFGTDRIRQNVDLLTLRLNYRFYGPVIAKY
jgi:outer membrane immunogenic protein